MKKKLKELANVYNKIEEYLLVYSLVITVTIIFIQVIMRYVFNNSLSWSEELARYIFIWQIWLGTSLSYRQKSHIRITLLTDLLKDNAKVIIELFSDILLLIFCVFLAVSGFRLVGSMMSRNVVTPATQIPLAYVYLSLPISQAVLAIRILVESLIKINGLVCGKNETDLDSAACKGGEA